MASSLERIAIRTAARADEHERRIGGHDRTLYGAHGNGGLQADVHQFALSHNAHVKATDATLAKAIPLLDLVATDVERLNRAAKNRSRFFWIVATAAVAEAMALLFITIRYVLEKTATS